MAFRKIALVGLGLIGGSLGLVLKKRFSGIEVMGISRSGAKIKAAVRQRVIDWGANRPSQIFPQADLIVICTPVATIPGWVRQADLLAKQGTVVTDVGSTKGELVRWAEKQKFENISFVGSHPMAGSHHSGLSFAKEDLFDGSLTFVTRTQRTAPPAFKKILVFWKKISERTQVLSPEAHDKIVSEISHAPHALAALMVLTASAKSLPFAASGFMDTTRVAQGEPGLWRDIFAANRRFIAANLRQKRLVLDRFIAFLAKNDTPAIHQWLKKASQIRSRLNSA